MFTALSLFASLLGCSQPDSTLESRDGQTPPTDDIVELGVDETSRSGLAISAVAGALLDQVWELDIAESILSRETDTVTVVLGAPDPGYDVVRTCNGVWNFGEFECRDGAFVAFPIAYTLELASADLAIEGKALVAAYDVHDADAVLIFEAFSVGDTGWLDVPAASPAYTVTLSEEVETALTAIDPGAWTSSLAVDPGPTRPQFALDALTESTSIDQVVVVGEFEAPGLFE